MMQRTKSEQKLWHIDYALISLCFVGMIVLGLFAWLSGEAGRDSMLHEKSIVTAEFHREFDLIERMAPSGVAEIDSWLSDSSALRAVLRVDSGRGPVMLAQSAVLKQLPDQAQFHKEFEAIDFSRVLEGRSRGFVHLNQKLVFLSTLEGGEEGAVFYALEIVPTGRAFGRLRLVGIEPVQFGTASSYLMSNGDLTLMDARGAPIEAFHWRGQRFSQYFANVMLVVLMIAIFSAIGIYMFVSARMAESRTRMIDELEDIRRHASTDYLTGLSNRRSLFEHLRVLVPSIGKSDPVTVLLIDLDGFKAVNDTHGHQAGDVVLKRVGGLLSEGLRGALVVARLGGDEFSAILPGVYREETLHHLHANLAKRLASGIKVDGRDILIGLSIGAASSTDNKGDWDDLMRCADLAVYSAKANGRGRLAVFEPQMQVEINYRRTLERELRAAVVTGQLVVHHQPLVHAISEEVIGYESLVRWKHPVRGLIPPNDFIPLAEESDLIIQIGNFVLEEALIQLGPIPDVKISVNVTGKQITEDGFPAFVKGCLARNDVAPDRLCLEITESSLITERDRVAEVMTELRQIGVKFAIDDFGTGYSSLGYLLRFKFDFLKIDREFARALDENSESPMIVMTIVNLARSLGMQIIAEGIETGEQHRFMASAGCQYLQGYLFGRPSPISAMLHPQEQQGFRPVLVA